VQLFQNLLGNAAKFRSESPLRVSISAEAVDAGGWILRVRDNGIGIPEAARREVFGLFHRLHRRDRHSGNGIGLALCKRIVELHHGEIWIEDGDPGTVFAVRLPREQPSSTRPAATVSA
jgi:signal transduction histidine kinase